MPKESMLNGNCYLKIMQVQVYCCKRRHMLINKHDSERDLKLILQDKCCPEEFQLLSTFSVDNI